MRRVSILVLILTSFAALPSLSFAAQSAHPSRSRLTPCKVPGPGSEQVDALCGTYEVWENREARAGRKIGLRIVVLPARSANPLPDPVLHLAGGPGAAATPIARYYADSPLLQERDFVFIDQRGTGEPDRLGCRLGGDDLQSRLGEMFPLDDLRRCRDELAKKYDLSLYTVNAAVDDFDEIVRWLGYPKVNLSGGSYGTRMAQVYMRRHPEPVRSAVLWGVVPMDEPVAFSHAAGGQRALDLVLAACEEDAACRAKFPDARKDFQAVMDRLSQGPVEVEVSDPETGEATRARFSRQVVAEGIRLVLYSSEASAGLPLLFQQAAAGDWKALAQTVVHAKAGLEEIIARGLFFSVTCSQDFPFIDPAEVPARTAGSFLEDERVRRHAAVCEIWPQTRIDPQDREAIRSDIPVLLISGERDPVTPPDFARRTSRFLTHSLHFVEPGQSHEDSPPCVMALMEDFIRRGTTTGIDTSSCLAQVKPRPFLFELPDEGIMPFKSAATAAPKLELKPCTDVPSLPPESRCGTYEVWENRAAKSGRKIPLRVAVIPALGPDRLPDALTFFTGGPGESNVAAAPEALEMFRPLRQRRDILLVDFRGTGGSNGLFCPEMQGSAGAQGLLDSYYPPEKVKACAGRLAKAADFSQYTNDTSVDDVDEVRAALGYPQLNIYGGSGGSRTALIYLRRHPDKVRTATIAAVAPPDERGPFSMARHAQRALDGLIAECEADAACRGAFPRLRDEVAAVLQQAEKEPVTVPVIDGETGKPIEVRLTRSGVAQTLRYMLYRPLAASTLPLTVHLAAQGDWKLLAETGAHFASGRDFGGLADGYYLSLTCSEDIPFIREDEIPAVVRGTFLGDFRIRKQQAACAAWPVPPVDRRFLGPVVSDVPTLLLSGERDPVTPPVSAERAARTLKNSLSVVVPDGGHGSFGIEGAMECTDGLMARLIETGTVKGLDTSCLARTKRPDFALRWDPEVELPADQLARLTGTYKERTSGLVLRIETAGHRLKLLQGEYPPTVLMAVSPSRFRVEGAGNAFVDFQLTNGRATALTVPWAPAERWERKEAEAAPPAAKLELQPCTTIPGLPPEARCGIYEVWENRTAKSGRKIPLRVVVIPALGPDRLPDALTFFAGGPGESNVASAPDAVEMFKSLRQRRDILLVDFRGTGGSGGLFCPETLGNTGAQGLLDSYYPTEQVKACAERLAKTADFSQYTNDTSVDDVDEVRAALGYPQLNIYGGSGGSRTTLIYLRRHPDKVRTATISGVVPPDERGPFSMARHAQRALDGLIAECEADAACHGAFPRLRDEVAAVLQKAEEKPIAFSVIDGETGQPVEMRLTRSGLAQTLRYMLYRPLAASIFPLSVHLAAQGDWTLLTETASQFTSGRSAGTLADGYFFSLTCSEDLPFIREDEIAGAVQGTFLGDFRIRRQQAACAVWRVPPVDRGFLDPVVSDVPTLLLSGERDPVTPPASAERAVRTLKNGLAVVVPDGGHGSSGIEGAFECTDGLMSRFIETGTVQGLDTSCLARTKRPEFALRWDPEVELPADQLARLTGTYKERTSGLDMRIETEGHRLKLLLGEYPPAVLMAVSPTRFRVAGMGTSFVNFQITNGRVTSLTVPWAPAERWERKDTEAAPPAAKVELQPCTLPGLPPDARCSTYQVFENRAARSGRKIPLHVVVLPATGTERTNDPLIYFAGGPGASSIDEGANYVKFAPDLRQTRDVLLIDSRGTGRSAPLTCQELQGSGSIQGFLDDYMPAASVRACRDRLQKIADLSQYSTDHVVDDAEEIRTALGYGKVNLMGTSYGTRTVQIYMRRHPESVRTAVLAGVLPLDESFPLVAARYSQQGLDGLLTECEGDPACRKAFPKLREETAAVFRQVAKEPVRVQVIDAETGRPIDFTLSKNGLGLVLRRMIYYNNWISLTPLLLHLAAHGDWQPFAEFAQIINQSQGFSTEGYYLSVTCSEDLAFVREEEIPAAVAGTFLGDLRVRKQLAACAGWPAPKLDSDFRIPVTSDIPTLLISGTADPATPPSSAERVARTLERSRHVVIPDAGHGSDGMKGVECEPQMVSAFIAAGSAETLDTACVARMQRPDFLLSLEPEVRLKPEELERLAGAWSGQDGLEIRTDVVGGFLRMIFPDQTIVFAATSATRFRQRSGEPETITFKIQDGHAVSVIMEGTDGTFELRRKDQSEQSLGQKSPATQHDRSGSHV